MDIPKWRWQISGISRQLWNYLTGFLFCFSNNSTTCAVNSKMQAALYPSWFSLGFYFKILCFYPDYFLSWKIGPYPEVKGKEKGSGLHCRVGGLPGQLSVSPAHTVLYSSLGSFCFDEQHWIFSVCLACVIISAKVIAGCRNQNRDFWQKGIFCLQILQENAWVIFNADYTYNHPGPRDCTLGLKENLGSRTQNMYMNVPSSFVQHSTGLQIALIFCNRWMV